jgi:uncharacterized Zn finger protein (UPF0148 family)
MGTAAWVCFECRAAVRRDTAYVGEVTCPTCGKPCSYLGYKIPVPPKDKRREWAALHQQLARERSDRDLATYEAAVRSRHDLEQEIARLEAMPTNEGRTKAIRLLKRRLSGSNA